MLYLLKKRKIPVTRDRYDIHTLLPVSLPCALAHLSIDCVHNISTSTYFITFVFCTSMYNNVYIIN